MSKAYDFIKECDCFYVITLNGKFPAARPFGAMMEVGKYLYIATHDGNEAHKQLRANGNIQIIAKKNGTRDWVRLTGVAEECNDIELKRQFMKECPVLVKHYGTADSTHYLMFRIAVKNVEYF